MHSHNLGATHWSRDGLPAPLIKIHKTRNVKNLVAAFPTIFRKLLNSQKGEEWI
jgi:hypothetical protein